jgi:hypothetical protein
MPEWQSIRMRITVRDSPRGSCRDKIPCQSRLQPPSSLYPIMNGYSGMHYDAHQPVIDDLEARIVTIRDSL